MKQWVADMDEDEREEFYADILSQYDQGDALVYVFNEIKERREITDSEWYLEFQATNDGEIGGPVLAYNMQADYVNLTIPIFMGELNEAMVPGGEARADALQDLIEAKMATLDPYILALKAFI